MLNGVPKHLQGRKLYSAVRVLSKLRTLRSSPEMDLCLTILCQLVQRSMASIIVHLQNKVRPARHRKQPQLLKHGVILLQDNATSHCHHNVRSLVQQWGWELLAHSPYTQYLAPSD